MIASAALLQPPSATVSTFPVHVISTAFPMPPGCGPTNSLATEVSTAAIAKHASSVSVLASTNVPADANRMSSIPKNGTPLQTTGTGTSSDAVGAHSCISSVKTSACRLHSDSASGRATSACDASSALPSIAKHDTVWTKCVVVVVLLMDVVVVVIDVVVLETVVDVWLVVVDEIVVVVTLVVVLEIVVLVTVVVVLETDVVVLETVVDVWLVVVDETVVLLTLVDVTVVVVDVMLVVVDVALVVVDVSEVVVVEIVVVDEVSDVVVLLTVVELTEVVVVLDTVVVVLLMVVVVVGVVVGVVTWHS